MISENYLNIIKEIPDYVKIVLAVKKQSLENVKEAILAGAKDIGGNYVQETEKIYNELGEDAKRITWHLIGHLQKNKVNMALKIFDVIQTIDSFEVAEAINKRTDKVIYVLIEINSGGEENKSGVCFEEAEELIRKISCLKNIKINGLMTMGPKSENPEGLRPYFRKIKELFDKINSLNIPGVNLKILSMGMSDSYKIAIEEGSNMIRLGSCVFESRK